MSAILRQNFPQGLLPFVGKFVGTQYDEKDALYNKIFHVFNMDHFTHTDVMVMGAGPLREVGEHSNFLYDTMSQTWQYVYTATQYMTGFIISYRAIKDNKYMDLVKLRSRETKRAILDTKETIAANIINNAFNSSAQYLYGDGQPLIGNAHPIAIGPAQSNRPAAHTDVSEAALEQAKTDIANIRNERNLRINHKIKGILIPEDSEFEVVRILKSQQRVETADNDLNALRYLNTIPKIWVWNYLTDTDSWFLILDNDEGLKYGIREKATFDATNDFDNKGAKFSAMIVDTVGATDTLRGIYGSSGG